MNKLTDWLERNTNRQLVIEACPDGGMWFAKIRESNSSMTIVGVTGYSISDCCRYLDTYINKHNLK